MPLAPRTEYANNGGESVGQARRPEAGHHQQPRVQTAKKMYADKSMPVADICQTLGISRPTFYGYVGMQ